MGTIPEEWNWLDGHSPEDLEAKMCILQQVDLGLSLGW